MNRFYVITNVEKDKNLETTRQICNYLKARGCECTVREFQKEKETGENGDYRYTDASLIPAGTECILVLGGDGTLIQGSSGHRGSKDSFAWRKSGNPGFPG